jgi:hypothetical protein
MTHAEIDGTDRPIRTCGDIALWLAPVPDGGAVPVLRFKTAHGSYSLQLTHDELVHLHGTAGQILDADQGTIDTWLDSAASAVRRTIA